MSSNKACAVPLLGKVSNHLYLLRSPAILSQRCRDLQRFPGRPRARLPSGCHKALLMQYLQSNVPTAAQLLKSIAALTLREPAHSLQFYENGGPEAIVQCMKMHPDIPNIQVPPLTNLIFFILRSKLA